jgi:hypothetical protein
VHYVRQTVNIGLVANYAQVLRQAHGEYYMAFADDDCLEVDYISQCIGKLRAYPDVILVCGKWRFFRGEELLGEGNKFSLLQGSGRDRVFTYYQKLVDGNIFLHGVIRRDLLRTVPPMRNAVAADWHYVASIAFLGKCMTLEGTAVNKSVEGASASWAKTARTQGVPMSQATYWYLYLPICAFRDIAWASPVYESMGWWERLSLACQVLVMLVWRFRGMVDSPLLARVARLRKERWYQFFRRLTW